MNAFLPIHFQSGGCCFIKLQEGKHFHAEAADDDGTIDKTLPHVYTKEEQNALVWLAYRNQRHFALAKPKEPLFLAVPDFDPTIRKDLNEKEQNLGTEANSFMCKVYQILPSQEDDLHMITFCGLVNKEPTLQAKVNLINKLIKSDKNHYLFPLCARLETEYARLGTKKVHIYFFTDRHVKFINQAAKEFFELMRKIDRGNSNHTSCKVVLQNDFPKMTKLLTNSEINNKLLPTLDILSSCLPEGVLFIDQPKKSSKCGWKVYETDKKDVFIAVNYAQTTNNYRSADTIDALVFAFNKLGLKAKKMFNSKIEKNAVQVAFTVDQLLFLNSEEFGYKVNETLSKMKMH